MTAILLPINIAVTVLFSLMKHPLSMGMTLLIQTITISLMTGSMNQNSWFSYILFLIMIGGMLILFMYMTSVASNEKFKTNLALWFITLTLPATWFMSKTLTYSATTNNELLTLNKVYPTEMTLNKFINIPMSMTLLFLMVYLLLALIATVKITNFKQGSIRQMN